MTILLSNSPEHAGAAHQKLPLAANAIAAPLELTKFPGEWRGKCPACGYSDAFVMHQGKKSPTFTYCFNGCSREDLNAAMTSIGGDTWAVIKRPCPTDPKMVAEKMEKARRLWDDCESLVGSLGETYLASRRVEHLVASKALRFHPAASHPDGTRRPALVAQVVDINGTQIGVHRTYLAPDGHGKAAATPTKASLGPVGGGAIRLSEMIPGSRLVVGEGIETTASAGLLDHMPAWAAISAGNLERSLKLPSDIRNVLIAVDPDPAGRRAARSAGKRWRGEGRKVRFAYPDGPGDFNDIVCAMAQETAHA